MQIKDVGLKRDTSKDNTIYLPNIAKNICKKDQNKISPPYINDSQNHT